MNSTYVCVCCVCMCVCVCVCVCVLYTYENLTILIKYTLHRTTNLTCWPGGPYVLGGGGGGIGKETGGGW